MIPERRTITIPRGAKIGPEQRPIYGYEEVTAYCAGGLAAHKALKGNRWKWQITHEASGMKIDFLGAMTCRDAIANMQAALAIGFDWTQGEEETVAALKSRRDVVDAIRAISTHN